MPPPFDPLRNARESARVSERERGPLETELHELIRSKGLASPELLDAAFADRDLSDIERINIALRMGMNLMEALLRLAREVDDLRAGR
jgi:hypothetical protein